MGPREGKGEVATSDFGPFVGDPRECRGYVAIPPNAYFMMQSFSMMEMQSSSIKVSHHESGVPTASLSASPPHRWHASGPVEENLGHHLSNGGHVTWPQFVDFLRVHRITAEACTCATYCTLGVCEGCLLWLLVKEPGFKVPLRYSWKFVGSHPFKFGRVRRTVVTLVEAPHVRALKSQGGPPPKKSRQEEPRIVRVQF